jgi:hypothetical protein
MTPTITDPFGHAWSIATDKEGVVSGDAETDEGNGSGVKAVSRFWFLVSRFKSGSLRFATG